ncbi:Shedu anti-phage system protein SduA domain-containing protein [Zavarzinella formosa]|uniref:Shedu anti-phage system protein SduA domain-containing protein n=1 Tax=Zavarzinella formosa TaxID=360055 RepID=UPI0002F295D2|nr:Shedu anti-phage system protein SduA domain-containing protein [Zavarzinella formosa]
MKSFIPVSFDLAKAEEAVREFSNLLTRKDALGESADILPLFRRLPLLCHMCHVGSKSLALGSVNRYATEYHLFGSYVCDLVLADWENSTFTFIEFEDAMPSSVFVKNGKKATKEWSKRFDHGCSQIIDWFHKIAKMTEHPDFEDLFGHRSIKFDGLLVIGRQKGLSTGELQRLEWRSEHVVVYSQKINCVTYDGLLQQMMTRLEFWKTLTKSAST